MIADTVLTLQGPDVRHLIVRRARPGDLIHVSDGEGRVLKARIEVIAGDELTATILDAAYIPPPVTRVSVAQGVAKGGKVDWVVSKLVELGVDEVIVFIAGRSVPRWDETKRAQLSSRYETLAYAASKQSRRAWLPKVVGPTDVAEVLELSGETSLVADPQAELTLREALIDPVPTLTLVVGPEGGLEPEEILQFVEHGVTPVRLGAQILRTETAGLVLASIAMFQIGRLE